MQLHSRHFADARRPVIFQVEDSLLFAPRANRFVEVDRFADALLDGKAACSERFKFANVWTVRIAVTGQRPELFDLIALDPHHAGADGRGEKLVQTGSEVIAVEVGDL